MAIDLAIHYARTVERHSYEYANEALSSIHQKLCIDDLNLCEETEALQKTAKRLAARRRYTSARFDIATETPSSLPQNR